MTSAVGHSAFSYEAVVLAGGDDKRLFPLSAGVPKALLPVANRPLLHYPLRMLAEAGLHHAWVVSVRRGRSCLCWAHAPGATAPTPPSCLRRLFQETSQLHQCQLGCRLSTLHRARVCSARYVCLSRWSAWAKPSSSSPILQFDSGSFVCS